MSAAPRFWAGPFRYWRWSARERPAFFYSCVAAGLAPVILVTVPPLRRRFGDEDAPPIPLTYPVPIGARKQLTGYGDETE